MCLFGSVLAGFILSFPYILYGNMEIYKSCVYKNEKKMQRHSSFSSLLSLLSAWLLYRDSMSVNFVATFSQ
jgi:Sec-independent protein secretion pathway component TatC